MLVTDGEQRAALALVRSLGQAGWRCIVTSQDGRSLAGASRHATRDVAVPDALAEPEAAVAALAALVRDESVALLVPTTEPAMLACLPARATLAPALIPFPDVDVFLRVSDKAALLEAATRVGISIPTQHRLGTAAELEALAPETLRYPLVLKPARSVGEHRGSRHKMSVTYANDAAELRRRVGQLPAQAFPLLLQQRIVGPGDGVFLLRWNDTIVARFAHRRLHERPPSGGVSVYREAVALDDELAARSIALLEAMEWRGVAMVEYKRDARDGTPYLMEINGRFWGSLQLAVDAGVDFPVLLAECALGATPAPVTTWSTGTRLRWWWGEMDHVLARLRRPAAALHLPADVPSLGRVCLDLATAPFRPRDREEILRPGDWRPFARETLAWIRGR